MVGIVIVSHSATLAAAVKELADQMTQGQAPIAVAGGIDDPNHPIGTDAMKVKEAIEAVDSPDGVLVLMDLGSALLSAETALEFLTPAQQVRVKLCAAPLVEGTLAAAVQAAAGSPLSQVLNEAQGALAVKIDHLQPPPAPAASASPVEADVTMRLMVKNRLGLHARPAANFVKTASQYNAEVWVNKGGKMANAKSINQIATLGVRQGDEIILKAAGVEAQKALAALRALADKNFGDVDQPAVATKVAPVLSAGNNRDEIAGIPASPGIAIGPVFYYNSGMPDIVAYKINDKEAEWDKLQKAVAQAQLQIKALQTQTTRQLGAAESAIFEAQELFLQDPALLDVAKAHIFNEQLNAEAAWRQAIDVLANTYRALDDEYLRERALDVLDVGKRVLRQMFDVAQPSLVLTQPAILITSDLTPSDTAQLDPANVLGICTELGGATSHSAIIARALAIPAVVGLNKAIRNIPDGQIIALNGDSGRLWLHPDETTLAQLKAQRAQWQQAQEQLKASAKKSAITKDNKRIEIVANIGGPFDAEIAQGYGAEGVGLFRTEFMFMGRPQPPSEAEQLVVYLQAAQAMGKRPLIIRTLDVGGDKPIPYLDLGVEANPFLGQRGIRFCLNQPEIFKSQLRAILQASPGHTVKLMFPMIGALAELKAAKSILREAQEELRAQGFFFDEKMEVGIMIEVPAAVAIADQLAAEVDFFSIGTNDLTQYVMAADRGNTKVANLANALNPAVLRMIRQTVQAAHAAGIWVGMCGELAGNTLAAPLLLGLGLDELSMNAMHIPAVKAAIRRLTLKQAQQVARQALTLESAEAVQDYLNKLKI